jgi:hypothetical protein
VISRATRASASSSDRSRFITLMRHPIPFSGWVSPNRPSPGLIAPVPRLDAGSSRGTTSGHPTEVPQLQTPISHPWPRRFVVKLPGSRDRDRSYAPAHLLFLGDSAPLTVGWVSPPGMIGTFTNQLIAVVDKMSNQISAFHGCMRTSSKSCPAARRASSLQRTQFELRLRAFG